MEQQNYIFTSKKIILNSDQPFFEDFIGYNDIKGYLPCSHHLKKPAHILPVKNPAYANHSY
jgi:hypothetical protein